MRMSAHRIYLFAACLRFFLSHGTIMHTALKSHTIVTESQEFSRLLHEVHVSWQRSDQRYQVVTRHLPPRQTNVYSPPGSLWSAALYLLVYVAICLRSVSIAGAAL